MLILIIAEQFRSHPRAETGGAETIEERWVEQGLGPALIL